MVRSEVAESSFFCTSAAVAVSPLALAAPDVSAEAGADRAQGRVCCAREAGVLGRCVNVLGEVVLGVALGLRAGLHPLAGVPDEARRTGLPVLFNIAQLVGSREGDLLGAERFLHVVLREGVLGEKCESEGNA